MQITRIELYELVSKSPLSKVAPSLAISATTLAEICRKHNVPYPCSRQIPRRNQLISSQRSRAYHAQTTGQPLRLQRLRSRASKLLLLSPYRSQRSGRPNRTRSSRNGLLIASVAVGRQRRAVIPGGSRWRLRCRISIDVVTPFLAPCFDPLKAKARRYPKPREACFVSLSTGKISTSRSGRKIDG
jgi:hypothetical protein